MTLSIVTEVEIREEIWQSFLGVLRCYAAVASFGGNVHAASDGAVRTALVHAGASFLSIAFDAQSGEGSYRIVTASETQSKAGFRLFGDGTIAFVGPSANPVREDLDHAAIRVVGLLASAAAAQEIEVSA